MPYLESTLHVSCCYFGQTSDSESDKLSASGCQEQPLLKWYSMHKIGDFRNVFKFHAYSVNKRFLTTAKLVRGLSDVATTNVCKVDTSNRNHIERSRWMKWLITGLRQKKYPLVWIHYESGLLVHEPIDSNIHSDPLSVHFYQVILKYIFTDKNKLMFFMHVLTVNIDRV